MASSLTQTLLVAFCAILAHLPVEGGGVMLIGGRIAAWAGGYTAKSYPQNGIVAAWDHLENIGYGQRSTTTNTWADLTGNGYDMHITALSSVAQWESDGFRFNKTALGGNEYFWHTGNCNIQTRLGTTFTVGFTAHLYAGNNRNYVGFLGDSGDNVNGLFVGRVTANNTIGICATPGSWLSQAVANVEVSGVSLVGASDVAITIVCDNGSVTAYNNGAVAGTSSGLTALQQTDFCIGAAYNYNNSGQSENPGSYFRTPLALYRRVFVYERALSASEVQRIYAIDRARFNLS